MKTKMDFSTGIPLLGKIYYKNYLHIMIRFSHDFSIFPDIVSKTKLNSFFKGLSQFVQISGSEYGGIYFNY